MLAMCPLWYIPHICLQQMLFILDDTGGNHRSAIAFAALYILSRLVVAVILFEQLNL